MLEPVKALLPIAALFALVGLLWLILTKLGLLKPSAKQSDTPGARYAIRDCVLSRGERALLPALEEAIRHLADERRLPLPRILASVRLAEVLEVERGSTTTPSARQSAFNRIQSKQADFVICNPETTRPLLIIELDDATHARPDRRERDGFLDQACASANLPILHIRAAASYEPARLAADIGAKLPKRT